MGYSATRRENPPRTPTPVGRIGNPSHKLRQPRAGHPGQEGRPGVAAAQVAQAPPRPAATKPAANQGPVTMRVEVVDPEGHPLPGADSPMLLWYSRVPAKMSGSSSEPKPITPATPRSRSLANAWGQSPIPRPSGLTAGRAFATSDIVFFTANSAPDLVHLTLGQPAKWTITVLSPDDRPIAGLRLTPPLLQSTRSPHTLSVPDGLFEPLTVTTDAKGAATLTVRTPARWCPSRSEYRALELRHTRCPLTRTREDVVLKLGRPGRVVGIVRTAAAPPRPTSRWSSGFGGRVTYPRESKRISGTGGSRPTRFSALTRSL